MTKFAILIVIGHFLAFSGLVQTRLLLSTSSNKTSNVTPSPPGTNSTNENSSSTITLIKNGTNVDKSHVDNTHTSNETTNVTPSPTDTNATNIHTNGTSTSTKNDTHVDNSHVDNTHTKNETTNVTPSPTSTNATNIHTNGTSTSTKNDTHVDNSHIDNTHTTNRTSNVTSTATDPHSNTSSTTRRATLSTPLANINESTLKDIETKYSTVIPSLDDKKVELKFEIEVGGPTAFTKELNDQTSKTFKDYAKEFKEKLSVLYSGTSGLEGIEVYGFRNGSIIALYRLILRSFNVVHEATTFIQKNVITKMNTTPIKINGFDVNLTFFQTNIVQNIENIKDTGCEAFSQDICPLGFKCNLNGNNHFCSDLCVNDNKPLCGEHGKCYIDVKTYKAKCSCFKTDGYVYHGEHCESTAEELKLRSIYIIAIAAGCGGALLIVTVVAISCLLRVKRKRARSPLDDKDTHFKSVSMDDIRLDQLDGKRPRQKTVLNDYQTGLPGQDIIYVQGREHRVHTDAKGDESYIYQPKSLAGSDLSTISQRPSVYDYIDTDSRFEIQRPYVHVGHLNKY